MTDDKKRYAPSPEMRQMAAQSVAASQMACDMEKELRAKGYRPLFPGSDEWVLDPDKR